MKKEFVIRHGFLSRRDAHCFFGAEITEKAITFIELYEYYEQDDSPGMEVIERVHVVSEHIDVLISFFARLASYQNLVIPTIYDTKVDLLRDLLKQLATLDIIKEPGLSVPTRENLEQLKVWFEKEQIPYTISKFVY